MELINKTKYTKNSLETYNLAIKLRKENGWGPKRIKRFLDGIGVSTTVYSINGWINQNKKPFLVRIVKQIAENSGELTPEKAYIIGTLCGDGYISTDYRIGLGVCDGDFADYFKYCLEKVYGVQCSSSKRIMSPNYFCDAPRDRYVVSLVSKLVVEDLQSYVKSYKTKEWKVPEKIKLSPIEIQAAFIRGFADSEGSVRYRKGHGEITLHSINKQSLMDVLKLLIDTFKIKASLNKNNTCYSIYMSNYDSINKFYDNIGFIIKRKQETLKQLLKTYKRKGLRRYLKEYKLISVQLLKQGLKHRQIAKLLNTNHTNIYDWEKKFSKI